MTPSNEDNRFVLETIAVSESFASPSTVEQLSNQTKAGLYIEYVGTATYRALHKIVSNINKAKAIKQML